MIISSSVAAVQSCFCFIIVAAAIVLGIGALFLLFVLLYSQRVASQSYETLGEVLHHPLYHSEMFLPFRRDETGFEKYYLYRRIY